MVRKTEQPLDSNLSVMAFYDALAPEYDEMTGFQKRFVHEKPFFRLLVEKFGIRTALDAGCGTGFHSFLLAQLGVDVTAADISPEMLKIVRRHAKELGANVKVVESSFQSLPRLVPQAFDAVVSMGNSLAHLLTADELRASLECFSSILKPGGVLFLQNLNYDRILAHRERVQSVKEHGEKTFVRFYDYTESGVSFNILTIDKSNPSTQQSLRSVPLRPILKDELLETLRECRFEELKAYGSISMEEFQTEVSKDLVVLARTKAEGKHSRSAISY